MLHKLAVTSHPPVTLLNDLVLITRGVNRDDLDNRIQTVYTICRIFFSSNQFDSDPCGFVNNITSCRHVASN